MVARFLMNSGVSMNPNIFCCSNREKSDWDTKYSKVREAVAAGIWKMSRGWSVGAKFDRSSPRQTNSLKLTESL